MLIDANPVKYKSYTYRHYGPVFIFLLTAFLLLTIQTAMAASFQTDYEAIDETAKSVLMLEVYDKEEEMIATGSGFVAFDKMTLITNFHVIEDADYICALSDEGYYYYLYNVLAYSKELDIAILSFISPTDLKPLALAPKDTKVYRGEPVVAIGSPEGLQNTVSLGNISAIRKESDISEYQFTAPVSSGSSGGALLNQEGHVIGITAATYVTGQNLNLAIPISYALELYEKRLPEDELLLAELWQGGDQAAATPTWHPDTSTVSEDGVLTVTVSQDASVHIAWPDLQADQFIYELTCVSTRGHSASYYAYDDFLDIQDLIPGHLYTVNLKTLLGEVLATTTFQVPDLGSFTARDFRVVDTTIYWVDFEADPFDENTKLNLVDTCDQEEIEQAGLTRDYIYMMDCSMNQSKDDTEFSYLFVLYTPAKKIYVRSGTDSISQEYAGFDYYFSINNLFAQAVKAQASLEKGTYRLELYFDGQYVSAADFMLN